MTFGRCPWLAPSVWNRYFRLFLVANDSSMSETRERSLPEPSLLGNFHVSRGPTSLLQLLAQASRKIIGRILDLGPESRATMEELRSDEWFNACSEVNRVKMCDITLLRWKKTTQGKWRSLIMDMHRISTKNAEKNCIKLILSLSDRMSSYWPGFLPCVTEWVPLPY